MGDTDEDFKISPKEIKDFFRYIQKTRYKSFCSYKIDRWIIQACMFLVFGFLFYIAYSNNFHLDYFSCAGPGWGAGECKNPFYKPVTWVNSEYLPIGEYGTKPGLLFNFIWPITIGIFVIGFLLNHLIHNKKNAKQNKN